MDIMDYYNYWGDDSDDSFYSSDSSSHEPGFLSPSERRSLTVVEEMEIAPKPWKLMSLLDIAAMETAKHYPCQVFEEHMPPLDEALLKKIAFWAFPQDESQVKTLSRLSMKTEIEWKGGRSIFISKRIQEIRQVGFMVSAIIIEEMNNAITKVESKVSLTFEKQRITSSACAMCPGRIWCEHVIAVILYRIHFADQVPIHAPVTETLSTLTRDQLQKLLQYAINEDPGGILGSVFQHIDALRDPVSSLNSVQGAPDPTFGMGSNEKCTLELSLDKMALNLLDDLKSGYSIYPDSCNILDKWESRFYERYFLRISELLYQKEIDMAGKVLKIITREVFTVSAKNTNTIRRIFLDLERIWSCFLLSISGPIRDELIATALDINEKSRMSTAEFYTPNEWSDIATIALTSTSVKEKDCVLGAFPSKPFYQPVLASLLPKSQEINGGIDEDLPVMLLKFDSIILWPKLHLNHTEELCKLGIEILKKLLKISSKLSVMGFKSSKVCVSTGPVYEGNAKIYSKFSSDEEEETVTPRMRKRKSKYGSRPPASKKAKKEVKKSEVEPMEMDDTPIEGYTKAQLSYALLYITFMMQDQKCCHDLKDEGTSIWIDAVLRAIELGRFRNLMSRSELNYKDFNWLLVLEEKLAANVKLNIIDHNPYSSKAMEYVDLLLEHGLQIYGPNIPLSLICLLLNTWCLEDKKKVDLCVQAVCHTTSPLSKLTCNEISSVVRKWKPILDLIFKTLSKSSATDNSNSFYVTKVMKHLESVQDLEFVSTAYSIIRDYHSLLVEEDHKVMLVKMILGCVRWSVNEVPWTTFKNERESAFNMLIAQGKDLKLRFSKLVLPFWNACCMFFNSSQQKGLIDVLKESLKDIPVLPRDLFQMLLNYFQSTFHHNESCVDLLNILDQRDKHRREILKVVTDNYQNYASNALFLIAKAEHEAMVKGKAKNEVFQKKVFNLIQVSLSKHLDSSGYIYLRWISSVFAQNSSKAVAKGEQFASFMRNLSSYAKDPQAMVLFFESMAEHKVMLDEARLKLGKALLDCYKGYFDDLLRRSNHCAYQRLVNEIVISRQHFTNFVHSGEEEFKAMIKNIRKLNKGKKKLLKILDEDLSELS